MVGQHAGIVLEILSDLGLRVVLQQGLEQGQHGVALKLRRGAQVIMCQRHIGRPPGLHGEGYPDDPRRHVVEAGGFGVEGKQLRRPQLLQPVIQRLLAGDDVVVHRHGFRQFRLAFRQQLLLPGPELHAGIPLGQLLAVRLGVVQLLRRQIQRHVGLDGRQGIGHIGLVLLRRELRGHGFRTAKRQLRHFIQRSINGIEASQALQQAQCRFFAHTGHSRNVVRLVAHQRQQVDHQPGRNPEFLLDTRHIEHQIGHGVDQGDMFIDQLGHVLVAGGNHHRPALGRGLAGESADHIVRLHTLHAQQRQPHRPDNAVNRLNLFAQLVRHGRTLGLVLGKHIVPESLALGVEHHRHRAARIVLEQAADHADHALHRPRRLPGRIGQRRQRMKGAVEIGGAVDQDDRSGI